MPRGIGPFQRRLLELIEENGGHADSLELMRRVFGLGPDVIPSVTEGAKTRRALSALCRRKKIFLWDRERSGRKIWAMERGAQAASEGLDGIDFDLTGLDGP